MARILITAKLRLAVERRLGGFGHCHPLSTLPHPLPISETAASAAANLLVCPPSPKRSFAPDALPHSSQNESWTNLERRVGTGSTIRTGGLTSARSSVSVKNAEKSWSSLAFARAWRGSGSGRLDIMEGQLTFSVPLSILQIRQRMSSTLPRSA